MKTVKFLDLMARFGYAFAILATFFVTVLWMADLVMTGGSPNWSILDYLFAIWAMATPYIAARSFEGIIRPGPEQS